MIKLTRQEIIQKLNYCFSAASSATSKYLADHPNEWYPCGFAQVNVHNGRSLLAKVLKEEYGAGKNYEQAGVYVWNPSNHATQWMYAKEAGCRAFVEAMVYTGLCNMSEVSTSSRMD